MNLIKHIYWRRISQREIRNSAAAEARAGREFISPTPPFLPAPPERSVLVSAALRAAETKLNARAGKKKGGWGE